MSDILIASCLLVHHKVNNNDGILLTDLIMADVTDAKTQNKIPKALKLRQNTT